MGRRREASPRAGAPADRRVERAIEAGARADRRAGVSAIAESDASHTSWQKALDRERAALAVALPLRSNVKSFLDGRLGKQNSDLQTFGFKPAKTPDTTVAAKATGIARTKATRAARHTMGSQQKKDIHGVPAGATPASPATAAPASATPAPSTATAPPVAPIKPSTEV